MTFAQKNEEEAPRVRGGNERDLGYNKVWAFPPTARCDRGRLILLIMGLSNEDKEKRAGALAKTGSKTVSSWHDAKSLIDKVRRYSSFTK